MMPTRFQLLASLAVCIAVVGASIALGEQQEGQTVPPSAGIQDVSPGADPEDVSMYGVFRLIPWGYNGALDYQSVPYPEGQAVTVEGQAAVAGSGLMREPAYLPDGYILAAVQGVKVGDTVVSIGLRYEGPFFPIYVGYEFKSRHPIDVHLNSPNAHSRIHTGTLGGLNAILEEPIQGDRFQIPISVRFFDDARNVETVVQWRVQGPAVSASQFKEILKIAQSLRN
jgi:hypothetical protein